MEFSAVMKKFTRIVREFIKYKVAYTSFNKSFFPDPSYQMEYDCIFIHVPELGVHMF